MTFWEFLDRRFNQLPGWPDGRGLVGAGVFGLTVMLLWMIVRYPELRDHEFFKTIATAIILTGFVNSVIAYAFGKSQAEREHPPGPRRVIVDNPPEEPVPVEPQE